MRSLVLVLALALVGPADSVTAQKRASPAVATALSGGSLLLGIGLIPVAAQFDVPTAAVIAGVSAAAIIAGPSVGFFYAGLPKRAASSTLLRIACLGAIVVGSTLAWDNDGSLGGLLALGGAAGGTVSAIYDVATVGRETRAARDARVEFGLGPAGLAVGIRWGDL